MRQADRLLPGGGACGLFAGYWPQKPRDPQADPREGALGEALVAIPRVVESRTMAEGDRPGTTIVCSTADIAREVTTLLLGGLSLHSPVLAARRSDRVTDLIQPLIVGRGTRLLASGEDAIAALKLRTIALTTANSGVRIIEDAREDAG